MLSKLLTLTAVICAINAIDSPTSTSLMLQLFNEDVLAVRPLDHVSFIGYLIAQGQTVLKNPKDADSNKVTETLKKISMTADEFAVPLNESEYGMIFVGAQDEITQTVMKLDDIMIDVLKNPTDSKKLEMFKTEFRKSNSLALAQKMLNSRKSNETNWFHRVIRMDSKYGGNRHEMDQLTNYFGFITRRMEMIDAFNFGATDLASQVTDTISQSRDEISKGKLTFVEFTKIFNDKMAKIQTGNTRKVTATVRQMGLDFVENLERTNDYWSRKVVDGIISKNEESSLITAEKIHDELAQIVTSDRFLIIVTNLCSCHVFNHTASVKYYESNGYTTIVFRSNNSIVPREYVEKEIKQNTLANLFSCEAKSFRDFFDGVATSKIPFAALFHKCKTFTAADTTILNSDALGKAPGWWMTGEEYAKQFEFLLQEKLLDTLKDYRLVLGF